MPLFDALERGFRYDAWANRRWLGWLDGAGWPEPEAAVFRHILLALELWMKRCEGESPLSMPELPVSEDEITRLEHAWRAAMARRDDPIIMYRNMAGVAYSNRLSEIAQHVINHGTYHRGELRGLCRAKDITEFPETDLSVFMRERRG